MHPYEVENLLREWITSVVFSSSTDVKDLDLQIHSAGCDVDGGDFIQVDIVKPADKINVNVYVREASTRFHRRWRSLSLQIYRKPRQLHRLRCQARLSDLGGCQPVNIIAPGMVIKLHGPSGEVITNGHLLIQPGATIWISVDKPCVWEGVDFYDYVDATYTQRGSIEPTITIHAYPAAGG